MQIDKDTFYNKTEFYELVDKISQIMFQYPAIRLVINSSAFSTYVLVIPLIQFDPLPSH